MTPLCQDEMVSTIFHPDNRPIDFLKLFLFGFFSLIRLRLELGLQLGLG